MKFHSLLFLLFNLVHVFTLAQVTGNSIYPKKILTNSNYNMIIWDVQLNIDLSQGTGAEFDGNFFYVTNGLSNLITKYDTAGTLIETFSIPGVNNLKSIAFDGTYMFGGAGAQIIYQMDFINKTLVNTIISVVNVRHIAYDQNNDAFWVGSWSEPIALISRTGTLINLYNHTFPFITGTAYDNVSPGGPYLWIFDRGIQIPGPQVIYQLHIPTLTLTGVTHDVLSDVGINQPNAVAGGLFSTSDLIQSTFSLGGILIGDPTILFVYELLNPIPVELYDFQASFCNGKIMLHWRTITEVNNRGFVVERKNEKDYWETIGFVEGHGTTNEPKYYYYDDDVSKVNSNSLSYRLRQVDYDGSFKYSNVVQVVNLKIADNYILSQNFPNPFNPLTTIKYSIPRFSNVVIKVFDILGNEIETLVDHEKTAGFHEVEFSAIGGSVSAGDAYSLPSGIYFYTLQAGDFVETKKMVLLR